MAVKTTKKKPATDDGLIKELLITVRELQKSQAQIIEQSMILQQKNAEMMQGLFKMWTPPETPNTSTGLDQRLLAKEDAGAATDWEPLDPMEMMDIVKSVGVGH